MSKPCVWPRICNYLQALQLNEVILLKPEVKSLCIMNQCHRKVSFAS